jgi:hypothetical protein
MRTLPKAPKKNSYYLFIGILGLLAVLLGFLTTYIAPSFRGTFRAPFVVHLHGAFAFGWVALFLVQTLTVKFRRFPLHRTLGFGGLFLALGIVATMLPVGLFQVKRELAAGLGSTAISGIVGTATSALIFALLVGGGFVYRRQPKIHKRLLLLATIVLLWPAWFRFRHYFPSVPRPDIWFAVVLADSLILLSWAVDRATYGRIHPVLLYGGLLIIAEHVFEVLFFDSVPWRVVAGWIYGAIG